MARFCDAMLQGPQRADVYVKRPRERSQEQDQSETERQAVRSRDSFNCAMGTIGTSRYYLVRTSTP